MTDEYQRQRELALAMLAQCDGATAQFENGKGAGTWVTMDSPMATYASFPNMTIRIKPKPRERWICKVCNRGFDKPLLEHMAAVDFWANTPTLCKGTFDDHYLSVEVLNE